MEESKKQILKEYVQKETLKILNEKLAKGEITEGMFDNAMAGIRNVANKVTDKVSDKINQAKDSVVNKANAVKSAYKQGSLNNQIKDVEADFAKFAQTLDKFNAEAKKYNVKTLSIQALLNRYRTKYPNLFKEEVQTTEEPIMESEDKFIQDIDMKKGALKKKLGLKDDEKVTLSRINSELKKLKDKYKEGEKMSAADLKFDRELNLAKNFLKMKK